MKIQSTLDRLHLEARQNKWLKYFAVFNRIALAAGFLPAGYVKIIGERFTDLSVNQPMGHYLDALHLTGYYYTFVGIAQVTAAILLLIPRTATLGAVLYFPIILNIFILSLAVRFEGSLLSSPLMVMANLYLLCWDYHKLKFIFPFKQPAQYQYLSRQTVVNNRFPTLFFAGVAATIIATGLIITHVYQIMPRNTLASCERQCGHKKNPGACRVFCDGIHQKGQSLDEALERYNQMLKRTVSRNK